jgi:potassium efflux system protein
LNSKFLLHLKEKAVRSFLFLVQLLFIYTLNMVHTFAQISQENLSSIDSILNLSSEVSGLDTLPQEQITVEESIRRTQDYTIKLNSINQMVNNFLDTNSVAKVLPNANRFIELIGSRIDDRDSKINLRYLNAIESWLDNILYELRNDERTVNRRVEELYTARLKLDTIKQDQLLRLTFRDTSFLQGFQETLNRLNTNLNRTDSTLNQQRLLAAGYQSKISNTVIQLNELEERIQNQKRALERALFLKETNFIWQPKEFPRTERLMDIFFDSFRLNLNITRNYINNHPFISIFIFSLTLLFYYWVRQNLQKVKDEKEFHDLIMVRFKYVHRYPFFSSLLAILSIAPFLYQSPPVSFFSLVLLVKVSISGLLLKNRIGSNALRVWWLLFGLFLISLTSNLYWEVAYQERWHLLIFNFIGIYIGWRLIHLQKEKEEALPDYIPTIAKVFILFCVAAVFANILGRFSLAKMIGITATLSLMHAIPLLIFIIIIKEVIYLQIEVSRNNKSGFTSVIDYYDIQKRVNRLASIVAVIIWSYFFLESLGILDTLLSELGLFLSKPRNILNATFTFAQIGIFILILYIASFLANTISYISTIKDQQSGALRAKKLGSSVLLIRLSLLIVGFLIAAAASGISMDKITIVLGAFSLGISFGLQTIVNNLVSGVILAFEKPIQIGDTVQVGNIEGIVRDIGIRASKIKNWDGAEVIIPNGDLLAQSLTNWTLSDKQRRVELIIGVSYNSDMDLVTRLIQKQLEVEGILTNPPSRVLLQTFADNSVNFRVLFWVEDIDVWVTIRDQVMRGIFRSFKENNVEIPFPQRDLHVKSFPGLIQEKVFKADD